MYSRKIISGEGRELLFKKVMDTRGVNFFPPKKDQHPIKRLNFPKKTTATPIKQNFLNDFTHQSIVNKINIR